MLTIEVRGAEGVRRALRKVDGKRLGNLSVRTVAQLTERNWKKALSGPRSPFRLGVRSNVLRSSVRTVYGNMAATVGTPVRYSRIHEYGGVILPRRGEFLVFRVGASPSGLGGSLVFARKVTMPKRPHLAPAVRETKRQIRSHLDKIGKEATR